MTTQPRPTRLVTRRYRDGTDISVSSPPKIARLDVILDADTEALSSHAALSLARESAVLRSRHNRVLGMLEALATSRMEGIVESVPNIFLDRIDPSLYRDASLISRAAGAVSTLCAARGDLLEDVRSAHGILLAEESYVRPGEYRNGHVWIGSTHPASAVFVAPEAARVPEHLEDLAAFAKVTPRSPVTRAAVAHAHFETVHPFSDGNGRIGRMLTQNLLHRYGVTGDSIFPLSAGLMSSRRGYIDALIAYRDGDAVPIVRAYSEAILASLRMTRLIVRRLEAVRSQWSETISVRRGSLAHRLLDVLVDQPAVTFASLAEHDNAPFRGASKASVYDALYTLERKGALSQSKADHRAATVWYSPEMIEDISSAYIEMT